MQFPIKEKFELSEGFLDKYKNIRPNWGFNGLGEVVFLRTYSRIKEDGKNEMWWECIKRVVEGLYSIQKQHIKDYNLGWNQAKAQKSAQEMYDRIFTMKMIPNGRCLWNMGMPTVMEKGLIESLFNCSFISSKDISENPGRIFAIIMDFLMLGVGVGFDTQGAGKIEVKEPKKFIHNYQISDDREGWFQSVEALINSYFGENNYEFDYSLIRKEGEPIKGFGGVSAGYKPLEELHIGIRETLNKNIGSLITVTTITNLGNMIGRAVVSGNIRRSAELVLGEPTEEFLNLKNYNINPDRSNFGWASNNSIYAKLGMDYTNVAKQTSLFGEPGYFFIENARKYGRMRETEANYKDIRVEGLNPCAEINLESYEKCVSGTTRILTKDGYPMIKDVVGKNIDVWNGDSWSKVKPFQTGKNKQLVRVNFSDGSYLDCTPNHNFSIETSRHFPMIKHRKIEAKDLKVGDTLEKLNFDGNIDGINDENSFEWGFFAGDGYIDKNQIDACICGDKDKLFDLGLKGKIGKPQIIEGYNYPVNRIYLTKLLKDLNIAKELNNKDTGIPEYFFKLNKTSLLEFVAGWIETDGTIQKNGESSWHYRVYGSYQKMVDLQLILRRCGIDGVSISFASPKGHETNYGIRNRDLFYITIPSSQCYKIPTRYKKIPLEFISSGMASNNAHKSSNKISNTRRQNIVSIEIIDGLYDTFCFTEEKNHKGVFGNVITHQCNLSETFISNHTSLDDYKKTLKYAYLFAKTVTLLSGRWAESNRVMLRNRRVGVSCTGIAQFLANHSMAELKSWLDDGYQTVENYDQIYSDWFAVPKSIKLTTVKPSGTVSLLAGSTPGIHYPESLYYIRRIRFAKNSPFVSTLEKAGYNIEPDVQDVERTCVVEFPVFIGDNVKTINDINIYDQLNLASFMQEHWADNSVSITVTFKKNEAELIASALEYYQFKLKTVSFLPKLDNDSPYPQMPYEEINENQYWDMMQNIHVPDFTNMFSEEAIGEKYCSNDYCVI